jgi:hypothetical protein
MNAWNHDKIVGYMVQEAGILYDIFILDSQSECHTASQVKQKLGGALSQTVM